MQRNSLIIKNCRLYNNTDSSQKYDILIKDSVISEVRIHSLNDEQKYSGDIIDAGQRITAPGLIDIHIQGAGGADILDGTDEAVLKMSKTLARTGTTSFLGTTVVKPSENNKHLRLAKKYAGKKINGATLLGFHLEGPFINPDKKGGINPEGIYPSSPEAFKEIEDIIGETLKIMTIAPELPGNLNIIKYLKYNGTIPAFAHSNATYEETKKGFEAGINHITHIFNAMPGFHHRNATALNAIFENGEVSAQIISDGHHLHSSTVKMVHKILGSKQCICITDGVQGIGLPEGRYVYNGRDYETMNGAARYLDGTLIGSTTSLLNIVLKFMQFTGCSFEEAIDSGSKNPAKLLGLNKGEIAEGKDADLIIINNDNSLFSTIVSGKIVYKE